MLKKMIMGNIVFLTIGLFLISSVAIADSSIVKEKTTEDSAFKEKLTEVEEIALNTRLESAKFKEKVLSQLGIWRAELAEARMMAIEAKGIAELKGKKVEELEKRVKTLQEDISLAKEMVATVKMQSNQTAIGLKTLSAQVERDTALLLKKVKKLEEKLAAKPISKITLRNLYRVKKGDTLWDISGYRSIYNDPFQWKKIYKTNKDKIKNPDLIYPGQRLFIPPKTSHQVLKGESLWSISNYESIYNDPFQWKKIYKTNKDKIKNPDLIYPGQRLIIPQE